MSDAIREERLRAAKEKLKKFQKKRQGSPAQHLHEVGQTESNSNSSSPMHQNAPEAAPHPAESLEAYFAQSADPAFDTAPSAPPDPTGPMDTGPNALPDPMPSAIDTSTPAAIYASPSMPSETTDSAEVGEGSLPVEMNGVSQLVVEQAVKDIAVLQESALQGPQVNTELERRNQELTVQVQQNTMALQQYETYCQQLSAQLTSLQQQYDAATSNQAQVLEDERASLKSQIKSHAESIEILVGEKSDLQARCIQLENNLRHKDDECSDANKKLSQAREEIEDLKQKLLLQHNSSDVAQSSNQQLADQLKAVEQELVASKQTVIDQKHDLSELTSKLTSKSTECSKMAVDLEEVRNRLEMAELNLVQLKDASPTDQLITEKDEEINRLWAENKEHSKRVEDLTTYIQQATQEREQIIHQYTSYSQQLATQIEALTDQLNEKIHETNRLANRETELVGHVEKLEGQMQKLIQGSKDVNEVAMLRSKTKELDGRITEMVNEREQMQTTVQEQSVKIEALTKQLTSKESEMNEMETKLDMLRSQVSSGVRQVDLVAACESDKVAASRAMKQNLELKSQLEELESALISMTNSKAEILNELDSLKRQFDLTSQSEGTVKMELETLKAGIDERDRAIGQLKDQMKYYVAFAENSLKDNPGAGDGMENAEIMKQLQDAKEEIRCLNSHNLELRGQLEVLSTRTRDSSETPGEPDLSESPTISSGSSEVDHEERNNNSEVPVSHPHHIQEDVPSLSQDVAVVKLEQKFKMAMAKVAELLSEKEQLEHIVVQLQEETDTVGEYITLYQYQRSQHRKTLDEKERQLQTLSRDKEELKGKLAQLQTLVKGALADKAREQHKENGTSSPSEPSDTSPPKPVDKPSTQANEILALLSEIESSDALSREFHPWFWDPYAGSLMTV